MSDDTAQGRRPSRDALALMMTGARSQRGLAAFLGISHQKLGRWLREGEPGGVKAIPTDPGTKELIGRAFSIYKDVARAKAKEDRLPFNESMPVYVERKLTKKGTKGDRIAAEHTQYLSDEQRRQFILGAAKSKKFVNVSVRSTVNLVRYNKAAERIHRAMKRDRLSSVEKHRLEDARESIRQVLSENIDRLPIYTRYEGIGPGAGPERATRNVESLLRQKHEPATGEAKTAFADMILLQAYPVGYLEDQRKRARAERRESIKRDNARRKR